MAERDIDRDLAEVLMQNRQGPYQDVMPPINPNYSEYGPWAPEPEPRLYEGGEMPITGDFPGDMPPPRARTWFPTPNFIDEDSLPSGELPARPDKPGLREILGHMLMTGGKKRLNSVMDFLRKFDPQITKTTKGFLPDGSPALGPEGEQLTREQQYNLRSPFKYNQGEYSLGFQNPLVPTDESYFPSGRKHYEPWENNADE